MERQLLFIAALMVFLFVGHPAKTQQFSEITNFDIDDEGFSSVIRDVKREGSLFYVLSSFGTSSTLRVFDFSNINSIQLLHTLELDRAATYFEVYQNHVYVLGLRDVLIRVYDYSNPSNPSIAANYQSFSFNGTTYDDIERFVGRKDNFLIFRTFFYDQTLIDLSNPTNLFISARRTYNLFVPNEYSDLGDFGYVLGHNASLRFYTSTSSSIVYRDNAIIGGAFNGAMDIAYAPNTEMVYFHIEAGFGLDPVITGVDLNNINLPQEEYINNFIDEKYKGRIGITSDENYLLISGGGVFSLADKFRPEFVVEPEILSGANGDSFFFMDDIAFLIKDDEAKIRRLYMIGYGDPNQQVSAAFIADKTEVEVNEPIQFTDQSSGGISTYEWQFQGGTPATSTEQHPVVMYAEDGVYNVSLTVKNLFNSDVETKNGYITVETNFPELLPEFQVAFDSINIGQSISFTDISIGDVTNWNWTFEGGTPATSTEQNPVVTYNSSGRFNVSLTVTDAYRNLTETKMGFITVTQNGIIADFEIEGSNYIVGDTIQFTNLSEGAITGYFWEFEGGDPLQSTDENPRVVYAVEGTFNVTLTVTNNQDQTVIVPKTITVVREPVIPDFTADQREIYVGDTVNFTDNSTGNITSRTWEFTAGDPATSVEEAPKVAYNEVGSFRVRLTVSDGIESKTLSRSGYITVTEKPAFQADFTANTQEILEGDTIKFTDASAGDITSRLWEFAGGTPASSTELNPEVVYATAGHYTVKLTIVNETENDVMEKVDFITVSVAPEELAADFDANTTTIIAGESVSFNDLSTGDIANWSWTFEGGTPATSTEQNPTVTFAEVGVYMVSLTIEDENGGQSIVEKDGFITVNEEGSATCNGLTVMNENTGTFDDGSGTGNYGNNMACSWLIEPDNGGVITLNVIKMEIENQFDFLRIYDGTNANGELLAELTGVSNSVQSFTAISGSAFISFQTDDSFGMDGWEIKYTSSIDETILSNRSPVLTVNNIYPNPVNHFASLRLPISGAINKIETVSLTGKKNLINYSLTEQNKVELDFTDLKSGVYQLFVYVDNEVVMSRFVKK